MEPSFINKYQPVYLKDFELPNNIPELLLSLINMDNLNIMLVGDTGSGKTSVLNSIIKEYYNGTCNPENILYINNLKEQGVQYYRNEVKTFCQMPIINTTKKKYKKFVVLDDIDTINEQSQQVFRNYIDKYSHNVNFIISCANLQKVIESIQSRVIIIKLNLLSNIELKKVLHKVKQIERISITHDAEDFIINLSNKSVKMMLNYIEKFKLMGIDIDLPIANSVCTNISFYKFIEFNNFCLSNELNKAINVLYNLYDDGYSVMDIYDHYFLFIKATDTIPDKNKYELIKILCKYISTFHLVHEDEIELAFFTRKIMPILLNTQC